MILFRVKGWVGAGASVELSRLFAASETAFAGLTIRELSHVSGELHQPAGRNYSQRCRRPVGTMTGRSQQAITSDPYPLGVSVGRRVPV